MRYSYFIFALICFFGLNIQAQTTTFTNPILKGFYPDPSIVRVGADYYLINSTFSYFPGIPVMHSKDLKNWKQIGNVIDRPSQLDFMGERMTRGLFAPAISYYKGVFYVTCTDIDHDGNFVVTATNPAGPWSDPVKIPQVRGIDPSLYFDSATDKSYIIYNSDAPDNKPLYSGHRTIRMYEFDYKNLKVTGDEKILVNGGVDISTKPVWIEGPHIIQKFGWYYLYAAEGGTSVNHSQVVLRSKDVWGPYVPYEKNPILTQRDLPEDRPDPITSAGHADLVEGPNGQWYAVFLAVRPYEGDYYNTGRETFLAPVTWKDEWPIINPNDKLIPYTFTENIKEVKQKGALPQSGNFDYTLTFDKKLDPSLLFLRTRDESSYSLSKQKGLSLKLKPETIMEMGNPSFIGKRQQHLYSTADVSMTLDATSENEKAGLVIFQDEKHFYYLCRSKVGTQHMIQLFKSTETSTMELLAQTPITAKSVKLRIQSEGDKYSFHYSIKGNKFDVLKSDVEGKFLSTKTAGGFIGCIYGMYATSSGKPSENTASFKFLRYAGNDPVYK
ncbi:MAG: glycoside hydrolase family 43 protein [Saprospiraceae bacterium]|nr:glycoside hydrolase family 43 protein [Saprospiraceae bacterium]